MFISVGEDDAVVGLYFEFFDFVRFDLWLCVRNGGIWELTLNAIFVSLRFSSVNSHFGFYPVLM